MSEPETQTAPQLDITQQVTSPTSKQHIKNPKRVAAGKKVAEKTRLAREEQKKALARYRGMEEQKKASEEAANKYSAADPEPLIANPDPAPPAGLSVNQWIGIGGLAVSAAGIYLKREEIMAAFKKNPPSPPPPVEPVPQRKGIRKMD